jgi:hypothetical protein
MSLYEFRRGKLARTYKIRLLDCGEPQQLVHGSLWYLRCFEVRNDGITLAARGCSAGTTLPLSPGGE